MNYVFLCGGKGERFKHITPYKKPLPLIYGRHIYQWCIDSFKKDNGKLIVSHNDDFFGECIYKKIKDSYHNDFEIVSAVIPYQTRGPAETVYISCKNIDINTSFWVLDNDNIYDKNINWNISSDVDICIVVKTISESENQNTGGLSPYGHVIVDDKHYVKSVVEKKNVSNTILVGAYGFKSWDIYEHVFNELKNEQSNLPNKEIFMSDLINKAISMGYNVKVVYGENSHAIGTPEQVQETLNLDIIKPQGLRWVFDLDETLVTRPDILGDYSTCKPIQNMIDFVNHLYNNGHHIIIHTARHMLTCNGDVDMVKNKIGEITENSLSEMGIKYHELIYGKPYADMYIDDKAYNAYAIHDPIWRKSTLGFGWDFNTPKDHPKIEKISNDTCIKIGSQSELTGYSFYLNNCGNDIESYVPKLYKTCYDDNGNVTKLIMEWKEGILIGKMFAQGMMTSEMLQKIFRLKDKLHNGCNVNTNIPDDSLILQNYYPKLKARLTDYKAFYDDLHELNISEYMTYLEQFYSNYKPRSCSRIHGDFWFSNLLWCNNNNDVFMIDMRGRLGETLHIGGDLMYDYAKMYQSLIGFDHVIYGTYGTYEKYENEINNKLLLQFVEEIKKCGVSLKDTKILTFTLLLGSFPFHKELKIYKSDYVILMTKLWDEILKSNLSI
jgi:dTDP-glucose pyrophosphorylase